MSNTLAAMCAATIALTAAPAIAWDAHGHATITFLALESARADLPDWLADRAAWRRVGYQASEADRFRGTRLDVLAHENNPEHYMDLDLLEQFGLTARSLPRLRNDYLRALIIAKHEHPERVDAYDAALDPEGDSEWPGFLPYAIMEQYAKLCSAFKSVRTLEIVNDPGRAAQLDQARANAIYHMGMLSHFVGDAAQPLHTTLHHHGWVGDNPDGFTTDAGIHARIDGGVLREHGIAFASLRARVSSPREIRSDDPWMDTLALIRRSFREVRPLYELERTGALSDEAGRRFIESRLLDAGRTLAGFYAAAWRAAEPTPDDVAAFLRYTPPLTPAWSPGRPAP